MSLRPYQEQAIGSVAAELARGNNRLLMQMFTSGGKTRTFSAMLDHGDLEGWRKAFNHHRTLVIAHREELLDQSCETLRALAPYRMVSIEQGPRYANRNSDVVVASIQTLAASGCRRLLDLIRYRPFGIVIIDEAHHAAAPSYRTVLVHLGFLPQADASEDEETEEVDAEALQADLAAWDAVAPKDRFLLGVTATPNRSDAIGLGCVFQSIAFTYPIRKGVEDGWATSIVPWVVDTSVSLDGVRTNRGDFNQRELANAVNNPHRNGLAVDAWYKYAHNRQTLAFTVDVQHAHDLADAFRTKGVRAVAISGETPKDERRALLNDYRRGQIDVIANCMILTEGTDLPTTSCILHAKPTKSATLFEQMTGRGIRLHPDDPAGPERLAAVSRGDVLIKPDCIVIDMIDVTKKHSLQTAPMLYGLPPGLSSTKGKNLSELAEAWESFQSSHPGINVEKLGRVAIEQLQVKASTFNVWDLPSLGAFAKGRSLDWVKTAKDTFRLAYPWQDGIETVVVAPDLLGQFAVSLTFRPPHGSAPARQRTLVSGVASAEAGAEIAEAFVRNDRPAVKTLVSATARWKKDPATERQKWLLSKKRIPFREDISKGEASNLLNLAAARAGR